MRWIFIFLAIPLLFSNTSNEDGLIKTGVIEGQFLQTKFYQGGSPKVRQELIKVPLANFEFYVIAHYSDGTFRVIGEYETDAKGKFSLKLPVGSYGFVTKDDLENLSPNQYLPASSEEQDDLYFTSITWEASISAPVTLTKNTTKKIKIIQHRKTHCMRCP